MTRDSDDTVDHQRLVKNVEGLLVSSVGWRKNLRTTKKMSPKSLWFWVLSKTLKASPLFSLIRFPARLVAFPLGWIRLIFLQIYAFLPHKESTFHRTLYVFICTSITCLIQQQRNQQNHYPKKTSQSVKIFRCQLPRMNPYYSYDPPKPDETDKPYGVGAGLCDWCGCWKGDRVCSNCKITHYCSDVHQTSHWSAGHKAECCQTISPRSVDYGSESVIMKRQGAASKDLWPEKEITQGYEDESESDRDTSPIKDDIDSYVPNDGLDDYSTSAFMDALEGDNDKKSWAAYQERIGKAPEQVLRYCRSPGAKPLWPMATGRPSKADIPKCNNCGGDLTYEFQILPQLLYYLGVQNDADSIDWETIAVYTCQASCDGGSSYKDEFAWVQLSSQPTVKP